MNINKLQKDLLREYCDKGLETSVSIANSVNMCQSTVYRNLFQPQIKLTKGLLELCKYANFDYKKYQKIDPKSHQYLMNVLTFFRQQLKLTQTLRKLIIIWVMHLRKWEN